MRAGGEFKPDGGADCRGAASNSNPTWRIMPHSRQDGGKALKSRQAGTDVSVVLTGEEHEWVATHSRMPCCSGSWMILTEGQELAMVVPPVASSPVPPSPEKVSVKFRESG